MAQLDRSWQRAWSNLELSAPSGLKERLIAAYSECHRRYHTLQHLNECIDQFDDALSLAVHAGEVEIALWFHDAIYELKAKDNEQRSAEWVLDELSRSGASEEVMSRVHALIMATRHVAMPSEQDEQLIVDIDLAILGANPARFAEYDEQVRAEYSWVPGFVYKMKRREVLRGFLDRTAIYSTDHFRTLYEHQARVNLQGAIS